MGPIEPSAIKAGIPDARQTCAKALPLLASYTILMHLGTTVWLIHCPSTVFTVLWYCYSLMLSQFHSKITITVYLQTNSGPSTLLVNLVVVTVNGHSSHSERLWGLKFRCLASALTTSLFAPVFAEYVLVEQIMLRPS